MPHSKREMMMVESRRAQVAKLYLQGKRINEIQVIIGLKGESGRVKISQDLKAIREAWKDSAIRDFDEYKAKLIEELALIKSRAWESFELSTQPVLTPAQSADVTCSRNGAKAKAQKQPGESRFLALIRQCVFDEAEIMGIKPKKDGDLPTSPAVIGIKIVMPLDSTLPPGTSSSVQSSSNPCPSLLRELPPGANPDDYEEIDVPDDEVNNYEVIPPEAQEGTTSAPDGQEDT